MSNQFEVVTIHKMLESTVQCQPFRFKNLYVRVSQEFIGFTGQFALGGKITEVHFAVPQRHSSDVIDKNMYVFMKMLEALFNTEDWKLMLKSKQMQPL